jgi:hypothetical protein
MSIDHARPTLRPSAALALAEAARVAGLAPSIHNTQPWRWRVDGDVLELYSEPIRQLHESDPGARLMVLSCGVALHHARTAGSTDRRRWDQALVGRDVPISIRHSRSMAATSTGMSG